MKPFQVKVLELKKAYDFPGSWVDDDYRQILHRLEVDEVDDINQLSSADLFEFLVMGLQDLEPEAAADLVLAHKLQTRITPGSRGNVIDDLVEGQRAWEEFADIALHSRIFAAAVLLHQVHPKNFTRPDLMKLTLQLFPRTAEAREILQAPPEAAFVTRLLADAMDEHSILERLFDEQLRAHSFPEAEGIIWLAHYEDPAEADSTRLCVYSSEHWLDSMESIDAFESAAYRDFEPDEDD